MKKNNVDIVVVGSGIVGLTFAALAAKQGLNVLILEQRKIATDYDAQQFDLRVSAITRASQTIFKAIDIWDNIVSERVSPYHDMYVWDQSGVGEIFFSARDIAQSDLGHIIENRVIIRALVERLKQYSNVDWLEQTTLQRYEATTDHVSLILSNDQTITCQLLVGADGGESVVRKLGNFSVVSWNYQHDALVVTVETEIAHQQTARQCFIQNENQTGTLAFLPLADAHTCSIVWAMHPNKIAESMSLSNDDFKLQLANSFDYRLGMILDVSQRQKFSLVMRHAKQYVQDRVALIGDAIHTIHPLAGQGVNLGILDAACLAEVIEQAHKEGKDFSRFSILRKFERKRKPNNVAMIAAMEGFKRLFGSEHKALRFLRNYGLSAVDRLTPLKKLLITQAMGLKGDLPEIAKENMVI